MVYDAVFTYRMIIVILGIITTIALSILTIITTIISMITIIVTTIICIYIYNWFINQLVIAGLHFIEQTWNV